MANDKEDFLSLLYDYQDELKRKVSLEENRREIEQKILDSNNKISELEMCSKKSLYKQHSLKELMEMASVIERLSDKDKTNEFKELVKKYKNHTLDMNDISSLETFIKLYGTEVKAEKGIIKQIFNALGGKL